MLQLTLWKKDCASGLATGHLLGSIEVRFWIGYIPTFEKPIESHSGVSRVRESFRGSNYKFSDSSMVCPLLDDL